MKSPQNRFSPDNVNSETFNVQPDRVTPMRWLFQDRRWNDEVYPMVRDIIQMTN
jgi:hypothetical protein